MSLAKQAHTHRKGGVYNSLFCVKNFMSLAKQAHTHKKGECIIQRFVWNNWLKKVNGEVKESAIE